MQIELKQKWFNLLNELEADLIIGKTVFQELVTAHTDESRHYHNLNHVWHLLTLADSVRDMAECLSAIELTAWFHDYVYNTQAKDNEIKSAIYATETLTRLNLDRKIIDLVIQIILSTQKHQPLINNTDNLLFLDLDLSILGAAGDRFLNGANAPASPKETLHPSGAVSLMGETPKTALHRYLEYAQAIRKEYSWLSDRDYQQGRKQVLTNFLAREKIYYTDYFYQKLERQARANLAWEIELYA